MERANPTPCPPPRASASWTWNTSPGWDHGEWVSPSRPRDRKRKSLAAPLAVFLGATLAIVGGVFFASERQAAARTGSVSIGEGNTSSNGMPTRVGKAADESQAVPEEEADVFGADSPAARPEVAGVPETITWKTESASTMRDLSRAWGIRQTTLAKLNPNVAPDARIAAGTSITVYSRSRGADVSVGAPNAGRLVYSVPLPEDPAWVLARGRQRAYGTTETIENLTTALSAYARRFPAAPPVEVGDISAHRGGKISSHNSHQSGRDADIMLVRSPTTAASRFSPERNWFLVKTLIDQGDVQTIFLNASEQRWLRSAAVADVGATRATEYFTRIRHERGHNEHMHVRFGCPQDQRRCENSPR